MTFDWHMLYPLHTVIFDNSQVFGGVPCKAQLCNFSKWFFSPRFGVVPIWELWQFCYVRIEPPKHVFKEDFLAKDSEILANMKIEADNVGQTWGGIFNVAWPSPNRPPDPSDKAVVYAVIP